MRELPRPWSFRLCLLLSLWFVGPTEATAAEKRFGDIVVKSLTNLPTGKAYGYHEWRFELENLSEDQTHEVALRLPADDGGYRRGLIALEGSAVVPPQSSIRLDLLQPAVALRGADLEVRIDGRLQSGQMAWTNEHPSGRGALLSHHSGNRPTYRLLLGRRTSAALFPAAGTDEERQRLPVSYQMLPSELGVEQWSRQWLAYTGYDGIVLSWGEMAGAPEAVRRALWRYVTGGGSLLLVETPEELLARAVEQPVRHAVVGAPRPLHLIGEGGMPPPQGYPLTWQYRGFGELLLAPPLGRQFSQSELVRLGDAWARSRDPWTGPKGIPEGQQWIPVVDSVAVPIRGLFVFVLLFSILVGPVNLWWLNRKGRRLWLLWTVPAASLAACGVVVLVALLGEGLRYESRCLGITVLDQLEQQATTLAWSGYYASLTTEGLRFSRNTEVVLFGGGGKQQRLRLDGEQHLSFGWLVPRLPSYFIERRLEGRRERLDIAVHADTLQVTNGLGARLDWLVVADLSGRLYASPGAVAAGSDITLEPSGGQADGGVHSLRDLFRGDLPNQLRRVAGAPQDYLQPGTYLAAAKAGPFFENALREATSPDHSSLIYGLWAEGIEEVTP